MQPHAVIRSRISSYYPIVELSDDYYHLRWYSDASKYLPHKGAIESVVSLLDVNGAHEEWHFCLPPSFLQSTHYKHHVRGGMIPSKPSLLLRYQPLGLTIIAKSPGNHFKQNLTRVRHERDAAVASVFGFLLILLSTIIIASFHCCGTLSSRQMRVISRWS